MATGDMPLSCLIFSQSKAMFHPYPLANGLYVVYPRHHPTLPCWLKAKKKYSQLIVYYRNI
jgi:hypothetical protein